MNEKIMVTVNEGRIRGTRNKSVFSGVEFLSFYGVPYGQPTDKHARYKDPVKVKPWKNVYDATVQKYGCLQFSTRVKRIVGSEDCLYNNIHTLKLPSVGDALKAVIVNVHPGGYTNGSPDSHFYGSPEFVIHHDVVYISIGYRLHFLGFLNLGMKECSGNQGIKDIILGLKWIKDNVSVFGGDPDNVTLLGCSTGATLIHCLMLSPAAEGLFNKAILMGMYLFSTIQLHWEEHLWLAVEALQAIGFNSANENEKKKLLAFAKKFQVLDLLSPNLLSLFKRYRSSIPTSPFGPTLDTGDEPVFPVSPRKLIPSTTRIPIMVGICENEAGMGFSRGLKKRTMDNFKTSFRQNCWGWAHHMTDDQMESMFEDIKSFYLNGKGIEDAPLSTLIEIQSDGAFSDIYESLIDVISADLPSSAYVYKFEFDSEGDVRTLKDEISLLFDEPVKGTFHGSDYFYWACATNEWGMNNAKGISDRSRKMIETFTKLITTFAKTGDPNYQELGVEWKPSTSKKPHYMSINDSLSLIDGKLNDKRMRFWEDLKKKYAK